MHRVAALCLLATACLGPVERDTSVEADTDVDTDTDSDADTDVDVDPLTSWSETSGVFDLEVGVDFACTFGVLGADVPFEKQFAEVLLEHQPGVFGDPEYLLFEHIVPNSGGATTIKELELFAGWTAAYEFEDAMQLSSCTGRMERYVVEFDGPDRFDGELALTFGQNCGTCPEGETVFEMRGVRRP